MVNEKSTAPLDFGIVLGVAYMQFVDELTAHHQAKGYDDIGPSFGYVFRVLDAGPVNLRQLADALGITSQGALKIVDDMERTGYVERQADPADGRSKRLVLTDRGNAALREARRFHRRFEARLTAEAGERSAASTRSVLEAIVARRPDAASPTIRPS